jgi:hypothetical protein
VLTERDLAARLAANGRALFAREFTMGHFAAGVRDIYANLLAAPGAA